MKPRLGCYFGSLLLWGCSSVALSSDGGNEKPDLQDDATPSEQRQAPIHQVRLDAMGEMRSGGSTQDLLEQQLHVLRQELGPDFAAAIEQNERDHQEDCRKSCELFHCADNDDYASYKSWRNQTATRFHSYSFGSVRPEDYGEEFGFPLDLIHGTEGEPLFSASEAAQVIATAEQEGVANNEYVSGKYRLGGDWLDHLPQTREWFNKKLATTFFPALAELFPTIVSSPAVLRAHSVSLLKYNTSHPRTDVHVDNGLLALTVAMTPAGQYAGGGTFFEHMQHDIIAMDVGHATMRPGSVRHGGHRVTEGTRYVLGAFFLVQDRVEHVRRLKNRGTELRRQGQYAAAAQHFQWALRLNPNCTTCLKDWAEISLQQKDFAVAEEKIRRVLDLLENLDSDALFTLGVLLSEQGRDDESIQAYQQSLALNPEDAELCYNLGVKLGAKGKLDDEMQMYALATQVDPSFGPAWLNWGTVLGEKSEYPEAEAKFVKALQLRGDTAAKAMMNLGLLFQKQGELLAQGGDLDGAMAAAIKASEYTDEGYAQLSKMAETGHLGDYAKQCMGWFQPLRLSCHRLVGMVHVGHGDLHLAEEEFRKATSNFPTEPSAWQLLGRTLEVQGKNEELEGIKEKIQVLGARTGR